MEKTYTVTFSYSIQVRAENREEAEIMAGEQWDNIMPRTDEMNIEVEEE